MYIDGFVAAVPTANKEKYRQHAELAWPYFKRHGALKMVEGWGDNVPEGKLTSFRIATQQKDDETAIFSWVIWPDKATRDKGWAAMMEDKDMASQMEMPFDGKRMFYGGFEPIVNVK